MGRSFLLLLVSLSLPALAAQPSVRGNIASAPFDPAPRVLDGPAPAAALAGNRGGFLLAWAAKSTDGFGRIYVARLGNDAILIPGTLRELPVAGFAVDANNPSVATDGNRYVVTWLERGRDSGVVISAAMMLGPGGAPFAAPRPLTYLVSDSPRVAWNGDYYYVATNGTLFPFSADFVPYEPLAIAGRHAEPASTGNGTLAIASTISEVRNTQLCGFRGCHLETVRVYEIRFTQLYSVQVFKVFNYLSQFTAGVARGAAQSLVAWPHGPIDLGGPVVAVRFNVNGGPMESFDQPLTVGRFAPEPRLLEDFGSPQIAWDGAEYLVVWQTTSAAMFDHDIVGAIVEPDGTVGPQFTIAATSSDERKPSVLAVSKGEFLVAFETEAGSQRTLGGRFVDLNVRHRPAR